MNCERCFRYPVCALSKAFNNTEEKCTEYCEGDHTITLPVFDTKSQCTIKDMQSGGYCFVNADLLKNLISESSELARIKAQSYVPKRKGRVK